MAWDAPVNLLKRNGKYIFKCPNCEKNFKSLRAYNSHKKFHNEAYVSNLKARMTRDNPMNYADLRKKVSDSHKKNISIGKYKSWNIGKKYTVHNHNQIVESTENDLKRAGFHVITTHGYIPDAIIIDFKNKKVKAFELNPGSILWKGIRAKEKGYDELIVKVRRNGKYARKNMDRTIATSEFSRNNRA